MSGQRPESAAFSSPTTMSILSRVSPSAASPGGSPRSPAVEKLMKIKETVSTLHSELHSEVEYKREAENSRVGKLLEMCVKNDKNLALEIKRRSEADKVLQASFENSLNDTREAMEKKMNDRFSHMQLTIEVLAKRTAQLEQDLKEERESRARAVEDTGNVLLGEIRMLQTSHEQEKQNRMDKEAAITRKLTDDANRLAERIESEHLQREAALAQLRDDLDKNQRVRDKTDEKFKSICVEEIETLKQGLRIESEAREASEEEMVRTMKDVINELKEGLHIISK